MNRARNFSNLPMAEAPQRPYKDWLGHSCSRPARFFYILAEACQRQAWAFQRPSGAFKRLPEAFQGPTVAFQRLDKVFQRLAGLPEAS